MRVGGAQPVPLPLDQAVGPVDQHLVGHREAADGGEDLPRVAHGDVEAEELGGRGQRRREVDGAEDEHAGGGGEGLDEHVDHGLAGLAPGAVVATVGAAGQQLTERIPAHDPVQVLVAEGADRLPVGPDQELLADARAIDDRGQGHRPVVLERVAELVVEAHRHQSIGSMKRWTVPPQVSPTANASSSE